MRKGKFAIIGILLLILTPVYAETNVTLLYGYNGSNWRAFETSADGTLQLNPNITRSGSIDAKTNNTYSIGSAALQWANVFTSNARSAGPLSLYAGGAEKVTILADGKVGIGNTNPQQALAVSGQANITGSLIQNGTLIIRGITYNWPSADGASSQILTTNGTGGLNWSVASASASNFSARNVTSGSFGADVGGGSYSFPANISVAQNISASGRITDKTGYVTPVGSVAPYSGALAPAGWLMANGSEVNRTTYPDLFNITGTRYGNTTDSTFKLPDLRQRFLIGVADSGTGSTLGGTGGAIDHTHTGPSHTHAYSTVISHSHSVDPVSKTSDSQGSHTHTFDPSNTASGGGSSHTHSVDPPSATSSSSGSHSHTIDAGGEAGTSGTDYVVGPNCCDDRFGTTGGGASTHTFDVTSFNSAAETAHTHTTDIGSTASGSNGGHTHTTNPAEVTSSSTGSASGTMDAGGTGATGTGNPPFLVLNFIVKY